MGAVSRGVHPLIRGLELTVPLPDLGEGGGAGDRVQSPVACDLINHARVMKPL